MAAEVANGPRAGVIGSPINHSRSPVLHRAAYQALGLSDWSYSCTEVKAGQVGAHMAALDHTWAGVSVTMPGKEEALAVSTCASERAIRTGAANTLVKRADGWWADNTDIDGITRGFAERGLAQARTAWLIGSGATARSALVAVAEMGVSEVALQVRSAARPETLDLARVLGLSVTVRTYEQGWPDLCATDVAISTVPAGGRVPTPEVVATDAANPADAAKRVRPGLLAMDVVYAPWPTRWATDMSTAGAEVFDGSAMLLHQAAEQVHLMTGHQAPVESMRKALDEALRARE